jgi:hypothetical protein
VTPPSTILAPDRERASAAAWGTLCLLAVVQIGLAVRLLTTQQSAETLSATAQQPVLPSAQPQAGVVPEIGQIAMPAPVLAPPLPGTLAAPPAPAAAAPVWSAPPPIGSFQQTNAAPAPALIPQPAPMPAPVTSSQPPSTPAPAPAFKPDPATQLLKDVNYVVTTAKEIRGMSDMQGALEMLKRADELTPDHPAIIAEIAQTYEQMGVATKATDSWRRIQLLGETNAGSFYQLASRRLGAGPAAMSAPLAMPGANGLEGEKNLRLGACQVARDFSVNNGERYTVRVPISRAGSQPVDGKAVNLEVFFFDRVNGAQVAQSIAPEPVETWQSAPVDWSGSGEETLDVVYHLPALSAAEIQQHGRRSYYGYMLRLYYNNKLQDVAAEPRDLLEFGSAPGSAPAGENPLLPPMGR